MSKSNITKLAKKLRQGSTDTERLLWKHLRSHNVEGLKFRRQEPIARYIVDFVCYEKKVVIELDGGQHTFEEQKSMDIERDEWLEKEGFKVLRFWNNDVLGNMEGVMEVIISSCSDEKEDE